MGRSQKRLLCLVAAMALVACVAESASAQTSIGKDLKQCKNGPSGVGPCSTDAQGDNPGWHTGTLNQTNALYRMGDFVPFRAVLTGLHADLRYTLRMGFRAVHTGLNSYDYVGSYDGSVYPAGPLQEVIPCAGVGDTAGPYACGPGPVPGAPSTVAVPPDRRTIFPDGEYPTGTGRFSAWGATLVDAGYVDPTRTLITVRTGGSVERLVDVEFIANGPTIVLAWGGHIASALDWGFGAGRTYAETGSGASGFAMYLEHIEQDGTLHSTGTVARNLNVNVVGRLAGLETQVTPTTVLVGQSVTDRATLTAQPGTGKPVTGQVRFFVCGPATAPPNCNQGGRDLGTEQVERASQGSANGVAEKDFIPEAAGYFCFRARYLPDPLGQYSPLEHTNTTTECFRAIPALLTVTKLCNPANDPGLFNLLVNGALFGAPDVPCGGSRGPTEISSGTHAVSEAGGTGTNLADYTTTFGGNCAANGTITLALGDLGVCEITNTRFVPPPPPPATASLTLTKACVPANDPGQFEVRVDGAPVAVLECGESTTAFVGLAPGAHRVSEVGVPSTNLSDYTTVISGDCAADGALTLAPGQAASCTITNARLPGATLRVVKACLPAGDRGRFNLMINGDVAGTGSNVGCRGTTGAVLVAPGTHRVGESGANGTRLARYRVVIGGDCARNGTVTIAAGERATCLIVNVRRARRPRPACYRLTVARRMVTAGRPARIIARVHLRRRPVQGVRVYATGPGLSAVRTTGRTGRALFGLRPLRAGILRLRIRRPFACPPRPSHRIEVLGVRFPSHTG